jgi:hypothetical protein
MTESVRTNGDTKNWRTSQAAKLLVAAPLAGALLAGCGFGAYSSAAPKAVGKFAPINCAKLPVNTESFSVDVQTNPTQLRVATAIAKHIQVTLCKMTNESAATLVKDFETKPKDTDYLAREYDGDSQADPSTDTQVYFQMRDNTGGSARFLTGITGADFAIGANKLADFSKLQDLSLTDYSLNNKAKDGSGYDKNEVNVKYSPSDGFTVSSTMEFNKDVFPTVPDTAIAFDLTIPQLQKLSGEIDGLSSFSAITQ